MDTQTRIEISEALRRNARRPRQHASFFEWDNKIQKEIGVCEELVEHLSRTRNWKIDGIQPGEDPPDCILICEDKRIAVEITELVDERAIRAQIAGDWSGELGEEWTASRLNRELNKIIRQKDLSQGKFDNSLLLLHTDEPELVVDVYEQLAKKIVLPKLKHFDDVYIVFGYDPKHQCRPVCQIK